MGLQLVPGAGAGAAVAKPWEFSPNPDQQYLLDFLRLHPELGEPRAACRAAGLEEPLYDAWLRQPGFRRWFFEAFRGDPLEDGILLLNVARAQAPHSYPHWRALYDLTFDPEQRQRVAEWRRACVRGDGAPGE